MRVGVQGGVLKALPCPASGTDSSSAVVEDAPAVDAPEPEVQVWEGEVRIQDVLGREAISLPVHSEHDLLSLKQAIYARFAMLAHTPAPS